MTVMGGGGISSSEWPVKAADSLETLVGTVRSRAVRPLQTIARTVVFGVIVAVMGLALAVFAAIGVLRLLDVYAFPPPRIWASYLVVGAIFAFLGVGVSSLRRARPKG